MSTKREVFVSVNVDLKGGEKLGQLAVRQRELQKENQAQFKILKDLEVQLAKNKLTQDQYEKAVRLATATIGRNRTELRAIGAVLRETENQTAGLTTASLRFRDKMSDAFGGKLKSLVTSFGSTIGAAFAVQSLISFGKELEDLAVKGELLDRKAKVLFGESLPQVTAAAEKNANAIGLTKREYIALASAQQDVFTNLGFGKAQTAALATQIVDLSGKLEDWTAGEIDAARASDILKDATLGKTKGLAELGIAIKANKEELEARVEVIMREQNVTKGQAEALANLELVYGSVTEKLNEFSGGQETLDDKMDKSTARMREQTEVLAEKLAPAFGLLADGVANLFDALTTDAGEKSLAEFSEKLRARLEKEGKSIGTTFADKWLSLLWNPTKAFEASGIEDMIADAKKQIDSLATLDQKTLRQFRENLSARILLMKQRKDLSQREVVQLELLETQMDAVNERIVDADGAQKEFGTSTLKASEAAIEHAKSIKELDDAIKALKEQQEGVSDPLKFKDLQKQIDDLEKQKVAITGVTEKVKVHAEEVKRATSEWAKLVKEMETFAPDRLQTIDTQDEQEQKLADAQQKRHDEAVERIRSLGAEQQAAADQNIAALQQQDAMEAELFELRQDRNQVLQDTVLSGLEIISAGMAQGITDTREFQKQLIGSLLKSAEALLRIELAKMSVQALAQSDSVATGGATGVVRIGILTALMEAAFAVLNGALQGFAQGGVVGTIQPQHGTPITRSNGDNRLITAKVGEVILNDDQKRQAEKQYGTTIWRNIGLPSMASAAAQTSLAQPFAFGGMVLPQSVPTLTTTQIIQAEASAKLASINFSPKVTVTDLRTGLGDFVTVEEVATL